MIQFDTESIPTYSCDAIGREASRLAHRIRQLRDTDPDFERRFQEKLKEVRR